MKINPNELRHYISKEALEELEISLPKIDTDLSKVTFYLWTPERGLEDPFEFKAGVNPNELLAHNFDPNRPTKFIAHGWTDNGNHAKPFAEGKEVQTNKKLNNNNKQDILSIITYLSNVSFIR